jgi:ubiquinone/menaquinone biosynthesis C-methylase UbiE
MKFLVDRQLAYFEQAATPEYWDQRWAVLIGDLNRSMRYGVPAHLMKVINSYIPKGSKVLEAGCGIGNIVYGLKKAGYECTGIDLAVRTVHAIKKAEPDLNIQVGDVRKLPFNSKIFDAYISVGVIEHFWDGYEAIFQEMNRILQIGGIAVISFPAMNLLRRMKRQLCFYSRLNPHSHTYEDLQFYQFALDPQSVIDDLYKLGYQIERLSWYEGFLGLADEMPGMIGSSFRRIYNNDKSHICSAVRRGFELLSFMSGYCCQITARKISDV